MEIVEVSMIVRAATMSFKNGTAVNLCFSTVSDYH